MQEYKEADINFEKETYPYFNIKHFGTQNVCPTTTMGRQCAAITLYTTY